MTRPETHELTVTWTIKVTPNTHWHLDDGSIEPIPGYNILFPDKHIIWVDNFTYEKYYLPSGPTTLMEK